MVISHIGITMDQTINILNQFDEKEFSLQAVWIIAIHSISNQQIKFLFPTIVNKDPERPIDLLIWNQLDDEERQKFSLSWLGSFLPSLSRFKGGGIMMGLLYQTAFNLHK